jgi:hypothetical protein
MDNNAVVTLEQLDSKGHVWRSEASQMLRANVPQTLASIRSGYNMDYTRIRVDEQVVAEPRRR